MQPNEKKTLTADGLVRVDYAREFLGLSRAKIYMLMDAGELPYCLIGRSRRIPKRALVEFAEKSLIVRG